MPYFVEVTSSRQSFYLICSLIFSNFAQNIVYAQIHIAHNIVPIVIAQLQYGS